MIKKITLTLCAIIIGFSTIFIGQNIVNAEENTGGNKDFNVIEYPPVTIDYFIQYKLDGGYNKNGLHAEYKESVNAIYFTGTINGNVTSIMTMDLTETMNIIKNSTYSIYLYTTNESTGTSLHSNEIPGSIQNAIFANRFFKFTATTDTVRFYIAFKPNHIENVYKGYYTLMMWQGDWELNKDIVNSLNYQIGFNEGKIQGYENGYNKGSTDGYQKGKQNAIETFNNTYYLNKYFFNSNTETTGKVYETKYSFPDDTLLGTFNLGVSTDNGLTFINAKEYYTDYTPQSYNYIEIYTTNEDFTYGYNQLKFNGLPIGTTILLTLKFMAKNEFTSIKYAVNNDGTLYYLSGGQQGYVPNTCLYSIRINGFIGYNFETGEEYKPLENATFFNFRNYANFSVTLPEDYINKSLYENGYNNAKNEYYNKWYIGRYQQGYNDGTSNAGNYTFLSLMGAVVDAPIKAISDMLNFNLLGFNMSQFFFALLTVCIIVTIVKLLL